MTASVTPESTSSTAYYVYGIVPADAPVEVVAEAGFGGQVELHTEGNVGALVEAVEIDRPLGRRRDLVAHSTVLNTMATHGPVLPMRFGSVVDGKHAVVEELLAPQQEHFLEMLDQVAGRVQFTLRAHYVLDTVLAEIVAADPEIAQLRRETADLPEDATHFKRIRLGELVSKAVDARRRADADDLISRISSLVEDWVAREVAGMDTMADFALLVSADKQGELESAAEVLAAELDGRVRLSLAGPMAVFDFVPEQ
jgi:hypothetical protein